MDHLATSGVYDDDGAVIFGVDLGGLTVRGEGYGAGTVADLELSDDLLGGGVEDKISLVSSEVT